LQEAILWAQEQGIRELDLTRGTEIYKTRFRTERHLNVSFVASRSWARCGWRSLVGIARDVPAAVWLAALMKDVGRCVHQILFARSMVDRSRWTKGSQATNEAYYAREGVVEAYARETGLQRPEITVLNELKPRLASMRMLDIGVGTGRTSVYFAPLVKAYTGLDHSRAMVDMARRLNMDLVDPSCFIEGDARAMTQVPDGSVDLVLMSFNGIDSMPSSGRAQVLAEVRRVLGSGGTFVFSSHNLQSVLFSWQGGFREALRRIGRSAVMAAANPGLKARASAGSSMLFDIAGDYRVPIHHTTPLAQQQELEAAGFAGVRVFSLDSGHEVPSERFSGLRDNWIYYLCQRP
jgi:SAM-dependent methyltransferase